jgi:hypothetical protein
MWNGNAECGKRETGNGMRERGNEMQNKEYGIRNAEHGIRNTGYGMRNTQYGIRNTECSDQANSAITLSAPRTTSSFLTMIFVPSGR